MNLENKRIFIDAHVFDDHFQGTRTYLKGLYNAMIDQNQTTQFFLAAHNIENLEREFVPRPNVSFLKLRYRSNLLRLGVEIPLLIRRHKIDVAHFQYAVPFIKTCVEVVTIHDILFIDLPHLFPFLYRQIRKPLFKLAAKRADLLLTVSGHARDSIAREFGVDRQQIHIIPNGIDYSFMDMKHGTANTENFKPYILYVSRIEPRKNHIILLQAYFELGLDLKGYKLVFIGKKDITATSVDEFLSTLPKERVENAVFFINTVSQPDLVEFYRNCSVFVYPSLAEGFGIPPLEAAVLGKPVICSNATAMADFEFFHQSFFDPSDKDKLKEKLTDILNGKLPYDLVQAKATIMERFNWERIARNYKELLERS